MNQNQRVLNHLIDHGYVTQLVASSYGIRRLASRITDLRVYVPEINVEMKTDDAGVRYAYYTLPSHAREFERQLRDEENLDYRGNRAASSALRIAA